MEPTTSQPTQLPQQNVFSFDYLHSNNRIHSVTFNSVFDSGNLRQVFSTSNGNYILHTAPDCCGTPYEGSQKSWYYFGVKGVPKEATLNFTMKRIWILASLYKSAPESYKPVVKVGNGGWKRIEGTAVITEDTMEKSLDVKFSYTFSTPDEEVFFAFTYPFSYKENQDLINRLDQVYLKDNDIYYNHEIITRSPQDRAIDLITISSHEGKLQEQESSLDENLFLSSTAPRATKFRLNKPVILISARVHPGETPASHTMNGILKFLLDKKDVRAQHLRNYFVFMLIPMLNPDGVANGHYRMDIFNQNLNRYYKNPDIKKQPSNFAVKKLVEYLHAENRLLFFCDLHAHAAKKGCFLYGNALDFVSQVESILFTKIMGLNCINFEDSSCNFSEKHMKARDKGEKLTKEGAARVCVFKISNLIHSYTMECGLHFSNELNKIATPTSTGWYEDEVSNIHSPMYRDSPTYYSIDIYQNLGKSMLVSLLDTFERNPCTRILPGTLENFRREIAARISKIPRFWKEANMKKKCIRINEVIKEIFYDELHRRGVFNIAFSTGSRFLSSTIRSNTLAIQTANAARFYKKSITTVNSRQREIRPSITVECSVDENVEQEQDFEEQEVQTLPRLRTNVVSREFRIKQVTEMKVPSMAQLPREENTPSEKKGSLQSTMRPTDRGVLVNSELMNTRELFSPNRTNLMIKDGKIQPFGQHGSVDNIKSVRKPLQRDSKALERKKAALMQKLPEVEATTTATAPEMQTPGAKDAFFLVIGGRNYMVSQPKGKVSLSVKGNGRKIK